MRLPSVGGHSSAPQLPAPFSNGRAAAAADATATDELLARQLQVGTDPQLDVQHPRSLTGDTCATDGYRAPNLQKAQTL